MPTNAEIIADRFHVMQQVTLELDTARKTEKKKAVSLENQTEKNSRLSGITKSKYSLLKNELDLTERQKEKLETVRALSPVLSKMPAFKEEFRDIFEPTQSWGHSVIKLLDWLDEAVLYYPKSPKTIVRWFGEIICYFDRRTTSDIGEVINNKLKLIKRLSYGFRNFNNFRLRSLLCWHFTVNYL